MITSQSSAAHRLCTAIDNSVHIEAVGPFTILHSTGTTMRPPTIGTLHTATVCLIWSESTTHVCFKIWFKRAALPGLSTYLIFLLKRLAARILWIIACRVTVGVA